VPRSNGSQWGTEAAQDFFALGAVLVDDFQWWKSVVKPQIVVIVYTPAAPKKQYQ
jgi:hypothetical protein